MPISAMKGMIEMIKKITAAILSLAFGACTVSAMSMTDKQKEELYSYNIMTGDENGDLRPSDHITRAEAARMICAAGNLKKADNSIGFADVPNGHWAHDYICAVKDAGIAVGDENGNFNPESDITNEEIVKMLVCLLGYDTMAEYMSGYPAGYNAVASHLGITSSLELVPGTPAIRSDVGIMICNSLDVPFAEQKSDTEGTIADGKNGSTQKNLRQNLQK